MIKFYVLFSLFCEIFHRFFARLVLCLFFFHQKLPSASLLRVRSSNGTNMSQHAYYIPNGIHATVGAICFGVLTLHKNRRVCFVSLSSSCIWLSLRNGYITFVAFSSRRNTFCQVNMFILPSETHTSTRNRQTASAVDMRGFIFKLKLRSGIFHCQRSFLFN